jgi:hypothetical protein
MPTESDRQTSTVNVFESDLDRIHAAKLRDETLAETVSRLLRDDSEDETNERSTGSND